MSVKGEITKTKKCKKFMSRLQEPNEIQNTEDYQEGEQGLGVYPVNFVFSLCVYRAPPSPEAGKHPPRTGEAAPIAVRIGRTHPKAEIEEKAVAVAPKIRHAQRVS